MSTDVTRRGTRRGGGRRGARRRRVFATTFAVVVGMLLVVGLGGAGIASLQGPRVTEVQFDPEAAISASGSRLILTTTRALQEVEPEQVTVTPATPFTVDTSGRSVGVRFTLPLYDDTEYTVRVEGLQAVGGGPEADVVETLQTPPLELFILRRSDTGDTIFRTDLTGESAVPVYEHPHIEDFRATSSRLVVSVLDEDDETALIVTDLDGAGATELTLPGDGRVTNLQSADRGDLIGYVYTADDVGIGGGAESVLYTASLRDPDAEPVAVAIAGDEQRVADWRFVPDTDALLVLTFDSRLLLSASTGADAVELGTAIAIDGIARGTPVAAVERVDGLVLVNLVDGTEAALPLATADMRPSLVLPLPDDAGTLQTVARFDGLTPVSTSVEVVSADGTSRSVFETGGADAVLQTCVSPSGRYAAVLVAPDVVSNPYDMYGVPLPQTLETHIVALADGELVVPLTGFDVSWCQVPPQ
ncbi:hypothetical protein H9651_07390 [Microbacterium sp. Sa4CUA7]|uniref:SbsA Ig-like domain-containing protein n=1 Tax=Microbacterium pullorum TaxID=2762236 RepID=A0ABR8S1V7_9MICO|nr:hypothetical protein [Microbacterium pullorum]MBD7957459.1 hypothetical protein [Microbacterium pullorum]